MTNCDCGATAEGSWAGVHGAGCASTASHTEVRDDPLPSRHALEAAIKNAEFAQNNSPRGQVGRGISDADLAELVEGARYALHTLPAGADFVDFLCRNPINQVYFRAGLLACREYMARFVESGGDKVTAQSIRANWWPSLGDDPGPPRLFDFDELAEELPDGKGWLSKPISPSIEALPRAYAFIRPAESQP